jgi:outer membrane protein OmpA-like peptidoglycan-associated protein
MTSLSPSRENGVGCTFDGRAIMNSKLTGLAGALAAAAFLLATPTLAVADTIQGNIISHKGNKLVVQSGGANTTVTLTDTTTIQAVSGRLGLQKDDRDASDLIKGLAVKIETVQNDNELDATKVTFSPADLKTAQAVQAGVAEARQNLIAAQTENERRLSQVGQFEEKGRTRVLFASGSVAITPAGKQALHEIASQAEAVPGSVLRVVGHADSTGNAGANQRLSDQRASAVTAYLLQNLKVPPEKMMSSTGLGASTPINDNDTSSGKAQNRRVTVFILVSKASQGHSSLPTEQ